MWVSSTCARRYSTVKRTGNVEIVPNLISVVNVCYALFTRPVQTLILHREWDVFIYSVVAHRSCSAVTSFCPVCGPWLYICDDLLAYSRAQKRRLQVLATQDRGWQRQSEEGETEVWSVTWVMSPPDNKTHHLMTNVISWHMSRHDMLVSRCSTSNYDACYATSRHFIVFSRYFTLYHFNHVFCLNQNNRVCCGCHLVTTTHTECVCSECLNVSVSVRHRPCDSGRHNEYRHNHLTRRSDSRTHRLLHADQGAHPFCCQDLKLKKKFVIEAW